MEISHLGIADAVALEPRLFDQRSSGAGQGIAKNTAAVGPVVGLGGTPPIEAVEGIRCHHRRIMPRFELKGGI